MVDDVEVKNVGGKFGVASEATMQLILAALGGQGSAGGNRAQNLAIASQNRAAKSTADLTKNQGLLISGIKKATGAVGGFANAFFGGADTISEFSRSVLGDYDLLSKGINRLTEFVDSNIASLRELSSVGASFNNSIFDMRDAAAKGEISFDSFSELIGKNSSTFALLGGTVSAGAKQIAIFTKSVRTSDLGKQLMGMGFSINDINQGMTDYLSIQLQSGKRINFRDKNLIAGSEAYLRQLDSLAKVTGKQREQISKDLMEQLSDAGVRNRVNALTGQQQTNFTSTLEYINSTMPGLSSGLKDLMDGVAQTDMGKLMQSQITGLGPLMEKVFAGQISEVDFNKALKGLQPQIDAFQKMYPKEMLDQMRQGGGIGAAYADLADNMNELNRVMSQDVDALAREANQRNKLTELFASFPQAIQTARGRMTDAFVDSEAFRALEKLGAKILAMVSGNGSFGSLDKSFNELATYLLGPTGILTKAINEVSVQIDEFAALVRQGGFLHAFETKLSELGSFIKNWFLDTFLGSQKSINTPSGMKDIGRSGGLFDSMISAFNGFWDGPYGQSMTNTINGYFSKLVTTMEDTFVNSFLARTILGIDRKEVAARHLDTDQPLTKSAAENIGTIISKMMYGQDAATYQDKNRLNQGDNFANALKDDPTVLKFLRDSALENQSGFIRMLRSEGVELGAELARLGSKAEAGEASSQEIELMRRAAEALRSSGYFLSEADANSNATGTIGFENFGKQSYATLHGVEAVVPKNTLAGSMLSKTFGDDWNNPKPNTSAPQSSNLSQESLVKLSNQLNTIMMAILAEIKKNNDIEKRTLTSVKGLNSDLFRGI